MYKCFWGIVSIPDIAENCFPDMRFEDLRAHVMHHLERQKLADCHDSIILIIMPLACLPIFL